MQHLQSSPRLAANIRSNMRVIITFSGNFTIDEDILRHYGVSDFSKYAAVPGTTEFKKGTPCASYVFIM